MKLPAIILSAMACLMASAAPAVAACAVKPPPGLVTPGALTIGSNMSTPPQMFIENGQPAGFEIDLSRALAGAMCLKPVFINIAFGGLFPGLVAHKFDYVTSGLGITPQRQQVFDFLPYLVGGIQLVTRKDSGLHFKDENDLCGHSVATISGTTQARAIETANDTVCKPGNKITLKYFPSFNDAIIQLRKKSADVAFVDWGFAAYVTRLLPELAVASPIISGRKEVPRNRLGMAFRKNDAAMQGAVTAALQSIEKTGEYGKILQKWHLERGDITKPI